MAPRICVCLVGPMGAGKSALLKALLDNEIDLTSNEGGRRSTTDLAFQHAKIHRCSSSSTQASCYRSCGCLVDMEQHGCDTPEHEMERMSLSRRVAFVDCPGNPFSVPAMLKGIMMADGVLILSQPTHHDGFFSAPTVEVLAAANLMERSIAVVQIIKNAADQNQLEEHKEQIRSSFSDLKISWDAQIPIVQLSAQDLSSIGTICRQIELMPPPTEASDSPALMIIGSSCVVSNDDAAASDDGEEMIDFTIHGRVVQGALTVADEPVEVRPGIVTVGVDKKMVCHPVILKVTSVEQPAAADQEEKEAADAASGCPRRRSAGAYAWAFGRLALCV